MNLNILVEDRSLQRKGAAERGCAANKRSLSAPPAGDSSLIFSALSLPPRLSCKPV